LTPGSANDSFFKMGNYGIKEDKTPPSPRDDKPGREWNSFAVGVDFQVFSARHP